MDKTQKHKIICLFFEMVHSILSEVVPSSKLMWLPHAGGEDNQIWGSYSDVDEDSSNLGCNAMTRGFRKPRGCCSRCFRNIGNYLTNDTASYPRILECSKEEVQLNSVATSHGLCDTLSMALCVVWYRLIAINARVFPSCWVRHKSINLGLNDIASQSSVPV